MRVRDIKEWRIRHLYIYTEEIHCPESLRFLRVRHPALQEACMVNRTLGLEWKLWISLCTNPANGMGVQHGEMRNTWQMNGAVVEKYAMSQLPMSIGEKWGISLSETRYDSRWRPFIYSISFVYKTPPLYGLLLPHLRLFCMWSWTVLMRSVSEISCKWNERPNIDLESKLRNYSIFWHPFVIDKISGQFLHTVNGCMHGWPFTEWNIITYPNC